MFYDTPPIFRHALNDVFIWQPPIPTFSPGFTPTIAYMKSTRCFDTIVIYNGFVIIKSKCNQSMTSYSFSFFRWVAYDSMLAFFYIGV